MKGPIAIIGAGPCGLSLARLLFRKNINFVVYEREASASALTASGSLDIRKDSGQRVLREAGLYDAFARQARWEDDRVTFFDKSGTALHTTGEGEREVGEDGSMTGGQPEIDRKELQNILLASIPEDKIIWGHRLRSLTFRGEKRSPILDFGNGQTAGNFPLIVGTDGAWSKVRAAIKPTSPQYNGCTFIETRIGSSNELHKYLSDKVGYGMGLFLEGASRMIIQRQGDNSYRIYFGITAPVDFVGKSLDLSNPGTTKDILLCSFFSDWAEELKNFIRHSESFRSWPLYQQPIESLDRDMAPGVTVAGDAAHLALPNGEGVNLAMVDALELASKIEPYGLDDIYTAVDEYEKDMRIRGKKHIEEGEDMERMMTNPVGAKVIVQEFAGAA